MDNKIFNNINMKKIDFILTAFFLILLILYGCSTTGSPPEEQDFIAAHNPNILYMGRVDFTNPQTPSFDWPGVSITAVFEGSYCGIALEGGINDYNVFIDGKLFTVISTKPGIQVYKDVCGLDYKPHTILLTKRTEGIYGTATFRGFYLEEGKKLLPPPETPSLNIEFIGDSITCGYGNEGTGVTCQSLREYQNNYLTYCAVASRELNAGYSVIAISGKGVVRNYGEKAKASVMPMPSYYDRVIQGNSKLKWDFSSWIPRFVVVNLGTNDYSTQPHPDKDIFINAYLHLLTRVRQNYPKADIFCLCGTMSTFPQCDNIMEIVDISHKNGDFKVHFVSTSFFSSEKCGCDWHPNVEAHRIIADELIAEIRNYM